MHCTRVGWSWNSNRGEGLVLDLHAAAGCSAGGSSPLEVEAAEMAGDVQDFANKEETGDFAGSLVLLESSSVSTPLAVTSAFS